MLISSSQILPTDSKQEMSVIAFFKINNSKKEKKCSGGKKFKNKCIQISFLNNCKDGKYLKGLLE